MSYFGMYILPVLLGVFSAIFIFFAKSFFYDTFLPRYLKMRSQGHSIEGGWESKFEANNSHKHVCQEFIRVNQRANQIDGDITETIIKKDDNSIVKRRHFKFKGSYEDSLLIATYWSINRRDKGRGSFCLLSKDNDTLLGSYSRFDSDLNQIISKPDYKWSRKDSPL